MGTEGAFWNPDKDARSREKRENKCLTWRIRVAAHIGHWCLLVLNRTLYSIPGYLGPHHPHILRLSDIFKWCNHEPKHQIQVHFCFYFKDIVLACFTLQFALALKNLTLSPVWSPLLFVLFYIQECPLSPPSDCSLVFLSTRHAWLSDFSLSVHLLLPYFLSLSLFFLFCWGFCSE